MKRTMLAGLWLALLVGCNPQQPAPPAPAKGGVQIKAPGVNVTVDGEGGTNVEAPGVKVKAGEKGAEVKVNPDK